MQNVGLLYTWVFIHYLNRLGQHLNVHKNCGSYGQKEITDKCAQSGFYIINYSLLATIGTISSQYTSSYTCPINEILMFHTSFMNAFT